MLDERVPLPRIGISRCLLGDAVRYDGGHKRDALLASAFGRFVEWVPVCPEIEAGMGTPREPIQLVSSEGGVPAGARRVRLLGVKSGADWTRRMSAYAATRVRGLAVLGLAGYVLKKDSPSCGLEGIPVHGGSRALRNGRGLFAEALLRALPNLPVEEEDRLHDPLVRGNFVERVFAYQRLRRQLRGRWRVADLVQFHSQHTLQLLSHSRRHYTELGRVVASAGEMSRPETAARYQSLFMAALSRPATPGRHADALTHASNHLKRFVGADERIELREAIASYRRGAVPLGGPLALIRRHVRRHGVEYLAGQTYLNPDPREAALRAAHSFSGWQEAHQ